MFNLSIEDSPSVALIVATSALANLTAASVPTLWPIETTSLSIDTPVPSSKLLCLASIWSWILDFTPVNAFNSDAEASIFSGPKYRSPSTNIFPPKTCSPVIVIRS